MMVIDANNYYFSDQHSVFVYSKKDNQLVKTLCKEGQGPWEISGTPGFCLTPNGFYVFDIPKVFLFDNDLKPLKEINLAISTSEWKQSILDDQIVYAQEAIINSKNFNQIVLFNPSTGQKKQIHQIEQVNENKISLYSPLILMVSNNSRLFVNSPLQGFHVNVFDKQGNLSYSFNHEAQKIKGTDLHKKRYHDRLEEALGKSRAQMLWPRFEKMKIPSFMPEIKWMLSDDERLYVQTYDIKNDEDKWLIFSHEGTFLGECWLPLVHVRKAAIFQSRFYYLRNTEDGWSLNSVAIEPQKKGHLTIRLRSRRVATSSG